MKKYDTTWIPKLQSCFLKCFDCFFSAQRTSAGWLLRGKEGRVCQQTHRQDVRYEHILAPPTCFQRSLMTLKFPDIDEAQICASDSSSSSLHFPSYSVNEWAFWDFETFLTYWNYPLSCITALPRGHDYSYLNVSLQREPSIVWERQKFNNSAPHRWDWSALRAMKGFMFKCDSMFLKKTVSTLTTQERRHSENSGVKAG